MEASPSHFLGRSSGDSGLDLPPEETVEFILGNDEPATDQVQALGDSISALWQRQKHSYLGMAKEATTPFVPAEPEAASLLEKPAFSEYGAEEDTLIDEFGDGCRIFVWRNSQWHPICAEQQHQIRSNLSRGIRVSQVSHGQQSWTVDARRKSEWIQISSAGTRRPLRCTPTILYHDAGPDFLKEIKAEWAAIVGDSQIMTCEDLKKYHSSKADTEDVDLMQHTIDDKFRRLNFTKHAPVTRSAWIHFRLLEAQAPSMFAIEQINLRLNAWMARYAKILTSFVEVFVQSCEDTGSVRLSTAQMKYAVRLWFSQISNDMFTAAYVTHLNHLMNSDDAFEEGEDITYYEFLNYITGQAWNTVELYYYDLSKGSASWWTPVLIGQSMPSIWHCGVVVYGKEYRYGGNIFESTPGATAFGIPQKKRVVGSTCRTRQDLLTFINRSVAHNFSVDSYQVLSNNSNHFCDRLTRFLTNKHIDEDILEQPKQIMRSKVARALSDWMPWLSGRGVEQTRASIAAQKEWEAVETYGFVYYEYEDGWRIMARVIAKRDFSCDLRWYNVKDGKFQVIRGVSRHAVQSLPHKGVPDPAKSAC